MKFNKNHYIKNLSYMPFGKFFLKLGYRRAILQLKTILNENQADLIDIYLLSNINSRDFIFGISDLNICFVVHNHVHPKKALKDLRGAIKKLNPLNIIVNYNILPIFTQDEFKSSKIRSLLATKEDQKKIFWKSIQSQEVVQFPIGSQGLFSSQHYLLKRFDKTVARIQERRINRNYLRLFGKNINQMITQFIRNGLLKQELNKKWEQLGSKLYGFNFFAIFYYESFKKRSWEILDQDIVPYTPSIQDFSQYPDDLIELTKKILASEYIEDVLYTPALLQLDPNEVRGKIFVDIVLKKKENKIKSSELNRLNRMILRFIEANADTKNSPRIFFQFTTMSIVKLKYEKSLFTFPIENLFRIQKTFSARGRSYNFDIDQRSIKRAIMNFLLLQFMRFRSDHLESGLIGSKFIKSLNLIMKYQMIYEFLEVGQINVPTSYREMLERITPQLAHLKSEDIISEDEWSVIKLQLLYYLKNIRFILCTKHPELKTLIF